MKRIVPCPVCRKPVSYTQENPDRPFCSERCRMIDLGKWLEEDYRVPQGNEEGYEERD